MCGSCGFELTTGGCVNPDCPSRVTIIPMQTVTIPVTVIKPSGVIFSEGFTRASGDCVCVLCGKEYRKHPHDMDDLGYDGEPFLRLLCDGRRVKL